jgi:NAD(P)H-dependent FMN reductase
MGADTDYPVRVLVFGASLRQGSLNDRLASLAATVVQQKGGTVDRACMADFDCPSYDGDVEQEEGIPAAAAEFRRRLQEADAFIISSPEYNASMPGVLKNAIDWVTRPRICPDIAGAIGHTPLIWLDRLAAAGGPIAWKVRVAACFADVTRCGLAAR